MRGHSAYARNMLIEEWCFEHQGKVLVKSSVNKGSTRSLSLRCTGILHWFCFCATSSQGGKKVLPINKTVRQGRKTRKAVKYSVLWECNIWFDRGVELVTVRHQTSGSHWCIQGKGKRSDDCLAACKIKRLEIWIKKWGRTLILNIKFSLQKATSKFRWPKKEDERF